MRLRANRQLRGDFGRVRSGEVFTVPERVGRQLLARGLAAECEAEAEPPALKLLREWVLRGGTQAGIRSDGK